MARFEGKKLKCIRGGQIIFEELSFSLDDGNILVLKGRNGAGKSSLLRVLAGLILPVSGNILWDKKSIYDEPEQYYARCHFVGHMNAIKPALTVLENISFWHRYRSKENDTPLNALKDFNLLTLHDVPARFLSAGQKRRLALARLRVTPAKIWLLDEPAASLDEAMVKSFETLMQKHRKDGGIIVISTHHDFITDDVMKLHLGDQ